ncbi:MAG TPA: dihydrofolate reductase family protein, partial [Acidimicrobiales bacterium]|nr:dihydrofolate reductase family protein [Acidimicrobiales bacterium]
LAAPEREADPAQRLHFAAEAHGEVDDLDQRGSVVVFHVGTVQPSEEEGNLRRATRGPRPPHRSGTPQVGVAARAEDLRGVHQTRAAEDQLPQDTVDVIMERTVADLIYTYNVSLDGFIEDDRGRFDFTAPNDDFFSFITGLERSAGTYLYGRRLYETMAVWETDPDLGAQSELRADFAKMWQAADKVVYSTTLEEVVTAKTRLERSFDAGAIRAMKASAPGHLTIGGANLAEQAFAAGLIDECRLFIGPVLLGGGKPALPRNIRVDLELIDEQRFSGGVIYLRYRVAA